MSTESQCADQEVEQVEQELSVHHHCSVSACKRPSVSHKAEKEHDLIADLKTTRQNQTTLRCNKYEKYLKHLQIFLNTVIPGLLIYF